MPISQDFTIDIGYGYAGDYYGLGYDFAVATNSAVGVLQFGVVVKSDGTENGATAGSDVAAKGDSVYGVSIRSISISARTYPSNGKDVAFQDGESFGLMQEGSILMKAGSAMVREQKLFINTKTGLAYGVTGADRIQVGNMVAIKTAAAGDIFPVRIFQA